MMFLEVLGQFGNLALYYGMDQAYEYLAWFLY